MHISLRSGNYCELLWQINKHVSFFSSGIKPNVPTSPILEFSFWTLLPSHASPSCVEPQSCVIIDCCTPSLRYATVLQVKFYKDAACPAQLLQEWFVEEYEVLAT